MMSRQGFHAHTCSCMFATAAVVAASCACAIGKHRQHGPEKQRPDGDAGSAVQASGDRRGEGRRIVSEARSHRPEVIQKHLLTSRCPLLCSIHRYGVFTAQIARKEALRIT